MATQTLNVNVNLNGLRGELQRSLQEVICLVATGLEAETDVEPENLALPTDIKWSFSKLRLDKETFRVRYSEWVLSNGFRDAIESIGVYLESVHRVLSIWELVEKQKGGTPISDGEWNSLFLDGGNRFHRLGLPDKLDHICLTHEIGVKDSYKEQILSINIARNCYVHRNGVVSDRDTNKEGSLRVSWSRLHTFLQDEDGEHPLVIGRTVEKGSTLCVRAEESEKAFAIGERLSFSVAEMSEILWCLFLFSNDLVMAISKFGEAKGFINPGAEGSA